MFYQFIQKIFYKIIPFYYTLKKNNYVKSNQPVFIVSSNRSGSSLLSSILRQHPSIRSISEKTLNDEVKKKNDHTIGFSEDTIWKFLENPLNDHARGKNEGFLWSHPKYLSEFYREKFFLLKSFYYEIYKDESKKTPLINKTLFIHGS